jgi:hypothetical protein
MIGIVVVGIFGLIAMVVDGSLIAVVGIVGRVVIMPIDDGLTRLAYSKITRLPKQLA